MSKEILRFRDIEIETPILLRDVDIEKVLAFNKTPFGEKKTINTLLVTYTVIIKLSHYI